MRLAFDHLFNQGQRTDAEAREGVEIYELRPTPECEKRTLGVECGDMAEPGLDVADFFPSSLEKAFEQGWRDVLDDRQLLERFPGFPVFRDVHAPVRKPPAKRAPPARRRRR